MEKKEGDEKRKDLHKKKPVCVRKELAFFAAFVC